MSEKRLNESPQFQQLKKLVSSKSQQVRPKDQPTALEKAKKEANVTSIFSFFRCDCECREFTGDRGSMRFPSECASVPLRDSSVASLP